MELGGNAPLLVFEDADADAAMEGAPIAKMRNGGEACVAANRFHVHEAVAEEFATKLAERIGAFRVGRGTDEGVQLGPLIDEAQRTRVSDLVADAVAKAPRCCAADRASRAPATSTSRPCPADWQRTATWSRRRSSGRSHRY